MRITRREFLAASLASAALAALAPWTGGAGRPALAAALQAEASPYSGNAWSDPMHEELVDRTAGGARPPGTHPVEKADVLIVGGGVAGLDAAWLLLRSPEVRRLGARVRLLEMEDQPGGVAREFSWNGIPYTNGAAYFYLFEDGHPIMQLYRDLGVLDEVVVPGKADRESVLLGSRVCVDLFQQGRGDPAETRRLREAADWFAGMEAAGLFPEVPFDPRGDFSEADYRRLDSLSLAEALVHRVEVIPGRADSRLPDVPPLMMEFIENFCLSSFGFSSWGVSAWQGLNWFASEFEEEAVGVLAGANGRMTTLLREAIDRLDPECLRTRTPVVDVEHDPARRVCRVTARTKADPENPEYRVYEAPIVVLACPLLASARLLGSELPGPLLEEAKGLDYGAYLVANACIRGPVYAKQWDTYCLDGFYGTGPQGEEHYRGKPYTDIINATWALRKRTPGASPEATVLTIYAPRLADQRALLLSDQYLETARKAIRKNLVERLAPSGLRDGDIEQVTLARWGHAMMRARPGLLSGGLLERLQESVRDRGLYLAGTDLLGAPTVENAHLTALDTAARIRRRLSG